MTYLYNDDHAQFYDAYWPTVDAQRLPGTTVSTKARQPHGTGGGTGTIAAYAEWVGGASYRDKAGAVGMHLINHDKTLRARKSWFCLADSIVALGAGITGTDGYPVETVVENRNLHAYILLPGASTRRTAEWAADPGVAVLANTADVQAIHSRRDQLTLANFWTAARPAESPRPTRAARSRPCV